MTPRPRDRAKGLYLDVVAVSNENVSFFLSLEAMVMDRVDVVTRIVGANFGNQVELDEYTAEYLLQSLLLDDAEDDLEQLRETLAGLLETLVGEGVGVSRCVDELVASRDELMAAAREGGAVDGAGDEGIRTGAQDAGLGRRGDGDKENDDSNSNSNSNSNDDSTSTSGREENNGAGAPLGSLGSSKDVAALHALQALFPKFTTSHLRRLLIANNSDIDLTANHLLSLSEEELAAEMARMRVADEASHNANRLADAGPPGLDESTKAAIKQSFLLEAVPSSGAGGKKSRKNLRKNAEFLNAQITKANESKQVRFRDGVVASTKGQRFIIESTKEEWNGGSSGKVYTKGKRGKGFVG